MLYTEQNYVYAICVILFSHMIWGYGIRYFNLIALDQVPYNNYNNNII